jgi:hypothetical protein
MQARTGYHVVYNRDGAIVLSQVTRVIEQPDGSDNYGLQNGDIVNECRVLVAVDNLKVEC